MGNTRKWPCRSRSGPVSLCLRVVAVLAALAVFSAPSLADETACSEPAETDAKPYIQLKPAAGPYNLYVMGDSLADGLWAGMARRFKEDDTVQVFRKSKVNSGIVRNDRYDWNHAVLQISYQQFHIAVMMFGANDLQSIRAPGRRHHFNTEGWHEQFRDRIDRIIKPLQAKKIAIYWVGLPAVQRHDYSRDYKIVNDVFREKMEEHGVKFIDIWSTFASKTGGYTPYGEDIDGKTTVLRHRDGVHFTVAGNVRLASIVEEEIRKDLAQKTSCLKKAENAQ